MIGDVCGPRTFASLASFSVHSIFQFCHIIKVCSSGKPLSILSPDSPPGAKAGIRFRLPFLSSKKRFAMSIPGIPTINGSNIADQDVVSCLTHTVLQEAADVHGSCNAGATASEVPGILLEVGLRQFLEDLEDLRCAARIDSLTHMMSNFILYIYMEVHSFFGHSSMQFFDRLLCAVGLGGYRVMSKNLTPGMQDISRYAMMKNML